MEAVFAVTAWVCAALMTVIAEVLCIAPIFSYRKHRRLRENGRRTEGEVIMVQVIRKPTQTNGAAMYRLHVSYTADGREYTAELPPTPPVTENDFSPYSPKVGGKMELMYDSKRPQSPVIAVEKISDIQAEAYQSTWRVSRFIAAGIAAVWVIVLAAGLFL